MNPRSGSQTRRLRISALVGAIAAVAVASGCRSNEPRTGDVPRLATDAADISHPPFVPGTPANRKWVTCSDGPYDLRDISLDLPQPVPFEFPGAPAKTQLCGVDVATQTRAYYTAPIDVAVLRDHYLLKLPARSCQVRQDPAGAEWAAILKFECPSGTGTLRISASAGAFEVLMDKLPANTPPAPKPKDESKTT